MTRGQDRGQATVEFALVVPLVFLALLAVVQVAAIAYAQLATVHIAGEAARTLAVNPVGDLAKLDPDNNYSFSVSFEASSPAGGRGSVHVVARRELKPVTPLFGGLIEGREVVGQARVLLE